MKFTEEMRVCEILNMDDQLEDVLLKHGLPCSGCPGAVEETLKEAAEAHGISIETLLDELNREYQ